MEAATTTTPAPHTVPDIEGRDVLTPDAILSMAPEPPDPVAILLRIEAKVDGLVERMATVDGLVEQAGPALEELGKIADLVAEGGIMALLKAPKRK